MATLITKNSQTASAVPAAASLSVGELAVNTADGKLYTEHTGGVVKEIIPSTVVDGGITTAKIADGAITTAKIANGAIVEVDIADGAITTAKLSTTGVTAGSYGSASVVPVVTVDSKGRLTSVSTATISAGAPTTAQVLSANSGLTAGAVGTYAFLRCNETVDRSFGDTTAASFLSPGSLYFLNDFTYGIGGGTVSGTWRVLGRQFVQGGQASSYLLYLRIA